MGAVRVCPSRRCRHMKSVLRWTLLEPRPKNSLQPDTLHEAPLQPAAAPGRRAGTPLTKRAAFWETFRFL